MDPSRFDTLARTLASRRTAVTGLAGGAATLLGLTGTEEGSAHNPAPACQKLADPEKRRQCLIRARRHQRQRHSCRPQPLAITCGGRCGTRRNNCRKAVTCPCPAARSCLINKGCSRTCGVQPLYACPAGCYCSSYLAEDGVLHCTPSTITQCEQVPVLCTSTAQCPFGHYCGVINCGLGGAYEGRCTPTCPS